MKNEHDDNTTTWQENKIAVSNCRNYNKIINELRDIENFISKLSFLSFSRDFVKCQDKIFSLQRLLTSAELTLGSIISCCEAACISDANILLRKYRDDIFFYIYICTNTLTSEQQYTKPIDEKIKSWLNNGLNNFYITDLLKTIGKSQFFHEAVQKFNLQESFNTIGQELNNYVHGNRYDFYNLTYQLYKDFEKQLNRLLFHAKYITVVFLFLLILCSPLSIMSSDYIDFLENGEIPPENSQYLVAPFVEEFIANNINLIDNNCLEYLRANTPMKL